MEDKKAIKASDKQLENTIPWQRVVDKQEPVTCKVHKFEYKGKGNNAQCDCGVGYQLPSNGSLKDGHIYIKDKLIV